MKKKLSFLLLGYSNIARKRIIEVFLKNKVTFSIASKSHIKKIKGVQKQFTNYEDALLNSGANIVYISLPNSLHFKWAKIALQLGYHVVVDKPICYKFSETKKLIKILKKKNRLLSEAIFYNYHSQFKKLIKDIKNIRLITQVKVNFAIPLPDKKSLLLSKKFKGGVIMDMGPYAASINRIFFNQKIISKKIIVKKNIKNIPISFNLTIQYQDKVFHGLFKFGGDYINEVIFYTKNQEIKLSRVFSPPSDVNLNLEIIKKGVKQNCIIKSDNCFENYFKELKKKIYHGDYFFYLKQIEQDHKFREMIQKEHINKS